MYYSKLDTGLCEIVLAGDEEGLQFCGLNTETGRYNLQIEKGWKRDDSFFSDIRSQLLAYIGGGLKEFDVRLNPEGSDFQKKVWKALETIPYGETRSYGEIAAMIGSPSAARAVGAAAGRNPVSLIIPCHRVIGSSGKLTGYAHGLDLKERLLVLEHKNS